MAWNIRNYRYVGDVSKSQLLFSAIFGIRNPNKEIFSELDEINAQDLIFPRSFQNTGGDTKWGDEAATQQGGAAHLLAARPCRVGPSWRPLTYPSAYLSLHQ